MANPEHLAKLKEGVEAWNLWRKSNPDVYSVDLEGSSLQWFDLRGANLQHAWLSGADLTHADVRGAILRGASLHRTDLSDADLSGVDLRWTYLLNANLSRTNLSESNLSGLSWSQWEPESLLLQNAILTKVDMSDTSLPDINLNGADLRGADLRRARLWRANLEGADLRGADLSAAHLYGANLDDANLNGAVMVRSDLCEAKLRRTDLREANLRDAQLRDAMLSEANMRAANLKGTDMRRAFLRGAFLNSANLSEANLSDCNLFEADLGGAILQYARLWKSVLTDCRLWDTSRAGWDIKGVICKRIYWGESRGTPTEYKLGEFESLYAWKPLIELFYEDGISTFELSTLPSLLQYLASKHPDANIRLKTIEQTGGGAKVTISFDDADESTRGKIEDDAMHVVNAQLQLRENDVMRLQIENTALRELHETTIRMMLTAGAPQTHFHGPVGVAALPSGNATFELHQTFNDNSALIQLIDKLLSSNTQLTQSQSAEIEVAKAELQKPHPDKSLLACSLDFLKTLPKEAILKGVGKLGEKAVEADWSTLLHQLEAFIHHL